MNEERCTRCRRIRPHGCRHYKPRSVGPVHGTRSTYTAGCRCVECRAANKAYELMRRHRAIARTALLPVASSWLVSVKHGVQRAQAKEQAHG